MGKSNQERIRELLEAQLVQQERLNDRLERLEQTVRRSTSAAGKAVRSAPQRRLGDPR